MSLKRNLGQQIEDAIMGSIPNLGVKLVHDRYRTKVGKVVGGPFRCRLESCRGVTYSVRWPNGKLTRPCTEGMKECDKGRGLWQIL